MNSSYSFFFCLHLGMPWGN